MKNLLILFFLLFSFIFTSCGSKKKAISHKNKNIENSKPSVKDTLLDRNTADTEEESKPILVRVNTNTKDYIETFAAIAMTKMEEHHIPASITLAQGILESSSGNSKLTLMSNNHFGIKCHKGWEGESVYWDDDAKGECFRKYDKAEKSFEDHSQFLITRGRYATLFELQPGDYVGWAYGLKAAGYATDKKYPQKLIGLIETYKLYEYDEKVIGKPAILTAKLDDAYYTVQKSEGLFSIAKKHNLSVNELKDLNNLKDDAIKVGQKLIVKKAVPVIVSENTIVQNEPQKMDSVIDNNEKVLPDFHEVQKGETLYSISKKYEVSIENIILWNQIINNELSIGQQLVVKAPKNEKANVEVKGLQHKVEQGDTLYSISKKHNVPLERIVELNHIENNAISIGQLLILE